MPGRAGIKVRHYVGICGQDPKTVSRDLNAVCQLKLVEETPEGYVATRGTILAFLPIRHEHEEDKIIKEWSQESEAQLDLAL
jgi:hypothetical protein